MAVADYKKSKAKRQRKQSAAARKRRMKRQRHKNQTIKDHNALGQYKGPIKPVDLDTTEEWRITALRKPDRKNKFKVQRRLDPFIEGVEWLDEGPVLEGTLTFREPVKELKDRAMIFDGDMVKCEMRGSRGGKWHEIWRMRCWGIDLALSTGTNSLPLKDDLANLQIDEGDYKFKKKKKGRRKKGWRAFEITRAVCKDARVRVGKLAKTKRWIEDLTMMKAHPLDVIIKAYQLEKEETGKSYVIRWRNGKLNIEPLRRNKWLYTLRSQITEALITHERSTDAPFYTVLTLTASKEKGGDSKKKEKLEVTVGHKPAMQRYGRIRHTDTVDGKVKNKAQLRKIAKRRLAKVIKKRTANSITVNHPGIPWIRRGDAVRIRLPEYGYKDKKRPWRIFGGGHYSVLFVQSIQHSIQAGSYAMDITFDIEDPIAEQRASIREAKNKKKREEKRKKRNKD